MQRVTGIYRRKIKKKIHENYKFIRKEEKKNQLKIVYLLNKNKIEFQNINKIKCNKMYLLSLFVINFIYNIKGKEMMTKKKIEK